MGSPADARRVDVDRHEHEVLVDHLGQRRGDVGVQVVLSTLQVARQDAFGLLFPGGDEAGVDHGLSGAPRLAEKDLVLFARRAVGADADHFGGRQGLEGVERGLVERGDPHAVVGRVLHVEHGDQPADLRGVRRHLDLRDQLDLVRVPDHQRARELDAGVVAGRCDQHAQGERRTCREGAGCERRSEGREFHR
jgi:hypothetical protein